MTDLPLSDLACNKSTYDQDFIFYTVPLDEQSKYLEILGGNALNNIVLTPEFSEEARNENKTYDISLVYFNKAKTYEG